MHRMEQLGFHSSQHDKCLGAQKRGNHFCSALVWVDDIVYGSTDEDFGRWFEAEFSKQFTIGDLGPLAWFLGIAFKAEQDELTWSHKLYISKLLTNFGMYNWKIASLPETPLPEKCALSKNDQPQDDSEKAFKIAGCDYRGLVGSISYLAMTTRLDLAFAAHLLLRLLNKPSLVHWPEAKQVLWYLRGTEDAGILAELGDTLDRVLRRGLRELQGRPQKRDWILFQLRQWRNLVVSEETDIAWPHQRQKQRSTH